MTIAVNRWSSLHKVHANFSQMQDHSIKFPLSKGLYFISLHCQSGRVVARVMDLVGYSPILH